MSAVKLTEARYEFKFDDGWDAEQYDKWSHYDTLKDVSVAAGRNAPKGCDFVVTNGHRTYLVEVKDYGYPGTPAPETLPTDIVLKTLDTLAGLVSAREKGGQESLIARKALKSESIAIVLAIGAPFRDRKLMQTEMFLANIKQQVMARTKPVLPHLHIHLLGERGNAWSTRKVDA